jgi:AcrR family transcriptional regulator
MAAIAGCRNARARVVGEEDAKGISTVAYGIDGSSVTDLMKKAGLTHSSFYLNFASRDELMAEAVERALQDGGRAVEAVEKIK